MENKMKEKDATLLLLEYLAEIERRRLFAERAYSSLFEFVVRELGYSESQASERISAMRLIREVIEVKDLIQTGDLTLTTASQIQRFLKTEKKVSGESISISEKLDLISECKNKSKTSVEKILIEKSSIPPSLPVEKERVISKELTELKFLVSEEIIQKLRKLENLSENSKASIFEEGLDTLIAKAEFKNKKKNEVKNKTAFKPSNNTEAQKVTRPAASEAHSRYIPKAVLAQVVNRSQNQCE